MWAVLPRRARAVQVCLPGLYCSVLAAQAALEERRGRLGTPLPAASCSSRSVSWCSHADSLTRHEHVFLPPHSPAEAASLRCSRAALRRGASHYSGPHLRSCRHRHAPAFEGKNIDELLTSCCCPRRELGLFLCRGASLKASVCCLSNNFIISSHTEKLSPDTSRN